MFEQRDRRVECCPGNMLHSLLWLACLLQVHLRSARRLCELCCANRGTFIKVGQHLGALDYLLPEEYTSTLKVLHSQAPQSSMQEVRQVIREDLGKEVPCCSGAGRDQIKK